VESLRVARRHHAWASANVFAFPGFTDQPAEVDALSGLIRATGLNMVQTRNLNMDPDWYVSELGLTEDEPGLGMREWVLRLRSAAPWLKVGYYNPPRRGMRRAHYARRP
jgi:hypothetical protein